MAEMLRWGHIRQSGTILVAGKHDNKPSFIFRKFQRSTATTARPVLDQEMNYEILNHFLGRIMFPISSLFHALKSRVSLNYIRVTTF